MRKEVITYRIPKSPISEVFRTLRTNLQFMNVNKKMDTLLITSVIPGEGKSWATANLAVTFAQAGKKVMIIDSDMRRGRQYAVFGVSPKPGLSNFLSQTEFDEEGKFTENVEDYIQETEVENLYIMTAGSVPPNPSELLISTKMIKLLDLLKSMCDIVIIDGSPSELVTDSVVLSRLADYTVIVTAQKITKRDALERVIKNIRNVGGKIAGVVVNKVQIHEREYTKKYYYYGDEGTSYVKKNKKEVAEKKKQEKNILNNFYEQMPKEDDEKPEEVIKENQPKEEVPTIEENNELQAKNRVEVTEERANDILRQINDYLDSQK